MCVRHLKGKMLKGYFVLVFVFQNLPVGLPSSLLCGGTKEVELGGATGPGAALAITMSRSPAAARSLRVPCTLRVLAPDAAAFAVRLIDVKENVDEWDRITNDIQAPGSTGRKWSARNIAAQDTATDQYPPVNNSSDVCKLLVFIGDAVKPIWRMSLCGGSAAAIAVRAGTKLLPPKIRIVWNPPYSFFLHTEQLRLVVTAVNSGLVCKNDTQFVCGMTSLCISSYLICDGVRHCPGGEDEEPAACLRRHEPPLLELLRRFAARNQELLGLEQTDETTKPSVIMKIGEGEQKSNAFMEFAAALKPYGPWSYLVVGMLVCATILMFCLAWECCCKRSKPSDTPMNIPASCIDLSPTVAITGASQHLFTPPTTSPPEYEAPPTYSSLFPRAYKCEEPVPQCSSEPD